MELKDKFNFTLNAQRICRLLEKSGGEVRFIGGCVRDILLDKDFSDIDIATNLIPDVVEKILSQNKVSYYSVGKEFGTIIAVIENEKFEITTLRKDVNCDGRYAKVLFNNSWSEDAMRRDFTINALSCDLAGNVFDYCNGLEDLKNSVVRFIGDPEKRIIEDYLRILRFFRFSAYYAKTIDHQGLEACKKHNFYLKNVSGARIRSELNKIFFAPKGLEILKLMHKEEILTQVLTCDDAAIKSLEKLFNLATIFNYQISEILILSLFFSYLPEIEDKIQSFGFTRNEKSKIAILIDIKIYDWSQLSLKNYWQKYKNNFPEIILLNLAISDIEINDKKELNKFFDKIYKDLPVKGSDLIKLNVKEGKDIGKLLDIADKIWCQREFEISKKEMLEVLSQYVNEL